jgi:hypothetical protein
MQKNDNNNTEEHRIKCYGKEIWKTTRREEGTWKEKKRKEEKRKSMSINRRVEILCPMTHTKTKHDKVEETKKKEKGRRRRNEMEKNEERRRRRKGEKEERMKGE